MSPATATSASAVSQQTATIRVTNYNMMNDAQQMMQNIMEEEQEQNEEDESKIDELHKDSNTDDKEELKKRSQERASK